MLHNVLTKFEEKFKATLLLRSDRALSERAKQQT